MSDSNLQAINQNAKQTITFSKDLEVADISESGAEVLNFDPDNVIGKHASEISFNFGYEEGRRLERVMRGEEVEGSQEVIGGDERLYHVSAEYSMVNCKGDECLHIEFEVESILIEPKDEFDPQSISEGDNVAIYNPDMEIIYINKSGAEALNYEPDEMVGMSVEEIIYSNDVGKGRDFEKIYRGEITADHQKVIGGNGEIYESINRYRIVNYKGQKDCLLVNYKVEDGFEKPLGSIDNATITSVTSEKELGDILENLRINTPDGPITLKQLMEDLDAGWKEIEDYRDGSLVLYQNLDERLTEELLSNPDGDHVEVLREAKQAVYDFHLHLRDS